MIYPSPTQNIGMQAKAESTVAAKANAGDSSASRTLWGDAFGRLKKNKLAIIAAVWIIFIILLILGVVLGLIYLLYCYMVKQKCPVCGTKADLMEPPRMERMQ